MQLQNLGSLLELAQEGYDLAKLKWSEYKE